LDSLRPQTTAGTAAGSATPDSRDNSLKDSKLDSNCKDEQRQLEGRIETAASAAIA